MRNRDSHTFPHLTLSLLTHAALASLVTIAPMLQPVPEGTVSAMEVEFTALTPPPLGQQLKTIDVGEHESEAPAEPKEVHPDIKELPKPKNAEVVAVAPPPKKNKLAAKVELAEKLIIKPTKETEKEFVATNDSPVELPKPAIVPAKPVESYTNKNYADKVSDQDFLKEDLEEMNDLENSYDNRSSDISDAESETEEDIEEELESDFYALKNSKFTTETAAQVEPETVAPKPREKVEEVKPAPPALTQGLPQKSQQLRHESNMNYGVPTGVRDYRELVQIPGNVPPQYPQLSRRKKEMGQVKLMYFVTSTGTVSSMKLTQSSGYEALDYEAIRAISKYKYQPGQQGYTSHTVNFLLRGDAKAAGGTLRTSSHHRKDSHPNN